ncbi:DNA ligase D [soil metagenome]
MSLKKYKEKRDFTKTDEPAGKEKKSRSGFSYVIQKHAASHLHYDFRLELDGVLLSWAVPKGPSLDPTQKRLAMHVEDHPVDYGDFEGTIPKGQYGGGTVMLWDRGWWEPIGDAKKDYHAGTMKFILHGERLKGAWALIRMHGKPEDENKSWLLIKEKDDEVRAAADYDITAKEMKSVSTKRTMEQIADENDRVWGSDRPPQEEEDEAPAPPKKRAKKSVAKKAVEKKKLQKSVSLPPAARKAPFPKSIAPQLATLTDECPPGDKWIHEVKHDGYRLVAMIEGGKVKLLTRRENDWTSKFPTIASALKDIPAEAAILDGEVVALDARNISHFQSLQNALKGASSPLYYYVFDIMHLNAHDLKQVPLIERKAVLEELLKSASFDEKSFVRYSPHLEVSGELVLKEACRLAMEGIISKRRDSKYHPGLRTRDWLKVKCHLRQEFVIGGYSEPEGSRVTFGALLVGVHDEEGNLRYVSRVGTGFNSETLAAVYKKMKPLERKIAPFVNAPRGAEARGVHWLEPKLVAEVEFANWTEDGGIRHASFQGLREDKPAEEVVKELPKHLNSGEEAGDAKPKRASAKKEKSAVAKKSAPKSEEEFPVHITNPDRVFYPESGITKRDLLNYYQEVEDWLMPHVKDRPLSLVRCPEGHDHPCFFQKHQRENLPADIYNIPIREKAGTDEYLYVKDINGVLSLVQMGVLEIHIWGSRVEDVENPDLMVFDLDPGEDVSLKEVIDGAFLLRDLLEELGLKSWVKTSGGKGYHIVVPLTGNTSWDEIKEFSKAIAVLVSSANPDKYVATMSKAIRKGKIFIDYLRNGRSATFVAAFSTRARAGAPISAPVTWEELNDEIAPNAFTIKNISARLKKLKKDPWADIYKTKQSITAAMKKKVGMS